MPLKKGKSKKAVGANVAELIAKYKKTGRIGNVKPKSLAHARRIAAAIAYSKAGKKK
jgi:hypothetical protein